MKGGGGRGREAGAQLGMAAKPRWLELGQFGGRDRARDDRQDLPLLLVQMLAQAGA